MTNRIHSISAALAVGLTASVFAAAGPAEAAKICYAFQDLSTGFWGAGHGAIVDTLTDDGLEVVELNGGKDANRQLEQIKDCIAQGADGIILTADDGDSETMLVALAQEADVPIATFNRPPSDLSQGHHRRRRQRVGRPSGGRGDGSQGRRTKFKATGKKLHPLILVGDLADPNAVKRREGFMNALKNHPDIFETPVEINTKWNSQVALAGLEAAVTADPEHRLHLHLVRLPLPDHPGRARSARASGRRPARTGHVILGGLDGDDGACKLIREGYVDSTGVQDVYLEAKLALDSILEAIDKGEPGRTRIKLDPGFALSQANYAEKGATTWGCRSSTRRSRPHSGRGAVRLTAARPFGA